MAKDGWVTSPEKDMRLCARVRRLVSTVLPNTSTTARPVGAGNLVITGVISIFLFSVIVYATIASTVPEHWISFKQALLVSIIAGIGAAGTITYFALSARFALRRAFISAAFLTLVATIGYGVSFKVGPTEGQIGSIPLQGASLLAAVFIVALLLIAFLVENRSPRS